MMEIHSIAPCDSVGQAFPIRSSIIIDSKDYRIDSLIDNLDMFEEEVACLLSNMRNSPSMTSQYTEASPASTRKRRFVSSSDDDEYSDEVDGSFENVDDCYDEEFGGEEEDWSETRTASNSSPNGSRSRGNRRKAASGTACEKHKRWKKRCPDDCPMRRGKIQKTSLAVVASSVPRSPSTPIIHSAQPASSLLTMIRWSSENRSNVTIDDLRELENQITEMRTPSPDSEDNSASDDAADFMEEKTKTSPIKAEETQIKAPQPRRRFRVSKLLDDEEEFSQDSAYTPRTQKKLRVSAKRTSGRKYLPSACERHKLLHAKCPANCPERLKRDADMASKRAEDIPFLPL